MTENLFIVLFPRGFPLLKYTVPSAIWEQAKNCVVSDLLVSLVSLANP